MTSKVFALDTKPGVQRDGTIFDKQFYNDGRWVRFQRGRPRKVGGYREIIPNFAGPSRGIYVVPQDAFTNVYNGHASGLQVVPINYSGIGAGVIDYTLNNFTPSPLNSWQFDTFYDVSGVGSNLLLAHPSQELSQIDSTINTPVLGGPISGTTMSKIGVFTDTITATGSTTVTIAASNLLIGAGQTVTGTSIPANTKVVSVSGTNVVLSNSVPAGVITATFDNNISVSGGVVALHPYIFVYGNDGLIKNCSAGNSNDWVSADANETNVATGKIVQGLPVRGGSNAPSGLFWSLDSLIRVSYIGGVGTPPQYWRYDIITSQSSILSSQSVIEYDGVYYWCGVDRFLLYNGVVKEIPNNMNQNYFFDNLNYEQRQKVWVTKVPRFGEIWWFYPRGNATECTDAIIYNVRENTWYDAGQALGARRSAGYFSQIFHYPINASWEINLQGTVGALGIVDAGSGYTDGVYEYVELTKVVPELSGSGAYATITVAGGVVTAAQVVLSGQDYIAGEVLTATLPGGSGLLLEVTYTNDLTSLYQHEFGTDAIKNGTATAIESYFETNDLGLVSGGPSEPAFVGQNVWLHLERVEPDFVQSGPMTMFITGRPYAQEEDQLSPPYEFEPGTGKIDVREQRRELRLIFISNVAGGDYQLGRLLLNADTGDVRGY